MTEDRIYVASDYAGIKVADYEFYYGYENIYCNEHPEKGLQESPECSANEDCGDLDWCFVAKKGNKIIGWYTQSKLETLGDEQRDETSLFLMAGIALLFKDNLLTYRRPINYDF